jgi:hypothetical protein
LICWNNPLFIAWDRFTNLVQCKLRLYRVLIYVNFTSFHMLGLMLCRFRVINPTKSEFPSNVHLDPLCIPILLLLDSDTNALAMVRNFSFLEFVPFRWICAMCYSFIFWESENIMWPSRALYVCYSILALSILGLQFLRLFKLVKKFPLSIPSQPW